MKVSFGLNFSKLILKKYHSKMTFKEEVKGQLKHHLYFVVRWLRIFISNLTAKFHKGISVRTNKHTQVKVEDEDLFKK